MSADFEELREHFKKLGYDIPKEDLQKALDDLVKKGFIKVEESE